MEFNKKIICIGFLSVMFLAFLICDIVFINHNEQTIEKVISPIEFELKSGEKFRINNIEVFDSCYTERNKELAKNLKITEDEAFILGNLGKYWAKNIVEGRKIKINENDFVYHKFKYSAKLKNSAFGLENGAPTNEAAFNRQLNAVKKGNFVIFDLDTEIFYPISKGNGKKVKNFVVVRKNHIKSVIPQPSEKAITDILYKPIYQSKNIKIIVSDLTTKIKPDRNCSSDICKEILSNINQAQKTIDMAIYGYSSTPAIEKALKNALNRGVKIRLVYDSDAKGGNIYPDTNYFAKLISDNKNDNASNEANNTMHNKFYIFDGKTVITGSANLSHTDMSGFNSNSIIVINSKEIAQYYSKEFEQMYGGRFHSDKISVPNKTFENIKVFFSPQDKAIKNAVLPLIKSAEKYIYIPAFVITEKRITEELINAKKRGVEIKIIADALNTSTKHSKHKELRGAGILLKAENYAGKMHSKTMIIDDEYLIIGSMNFSNSGENRNDENLIILSDDNAAKFYKKFFLYQWNRIPDKWLKYTPRAEGKDSVGSCSDGIDNNYDGKTDLEDEACITK